VVPAAVCVVRACAIRSRDHSRLREREWDVTVNDPTADLDIVLENIARIERFVAGCDEETFRNNEQAVFAVQYAWLLMQAAIARLGEWADVLHLEVPGRGHGSTSPGLDPERGPSDPGAVWQLITKELGALQLGAMLALNQLEGGEGVESR
jgi:hypothetical protein